MSNEEFEDNMRLINEKSARNNLNMLYKKLKNRDYTFTDSERKRIMESLHWASGEISYLNDYVEYALDEDGWNCAKPIRSNY